MTSADRDGVKTLRRQLADARATLQKLISGEPYGTPEDAAEALALTEVQNALLASEGLWAQTDAALTDATRSYRLLFDRNPHPMWVYDAATHEILAANDTALGLFGYARAEMLGLHARALLAHEARAAVEQDPTEVPDAGCRHGIWPLQRRDGTVLQADVTTQAIVFEDRPARLALAVDATDRVRAEQALRRSEQKFEAIFLASPLGIYIVDLQNEHVVEANPGFCALVGRDRGELIGASTLDRDIWEIPGQRGELMTDLLAGRIVRNVEATLCRRSGERRNVLISAEVLSLDVTGDRLALVLVVDVTERRTLEAQFRQAQKMEAVGVLAGGVAHDFNNLLGVIIGYAQLLEDETALDENGRNAVAQIRRAADRATSLTQQLLAFSRRQVMQPRILDLAEVVRQVEPMIARFIGEDIQTHVAVADSPGRIRADRGQIEQVLMNLASNARDAMPGGGRLTVSIADADVDAAFAVRHPGLRPGRYVRLSVQDSGIGMSEETRRRAFEPFFTTKPVGHGTGLGLATVYGIVKQSNGHVRVESAPGRGTTVAIDLPRVDEASDALIPALAQDVHGGSETILLVEDETMLQGLLADVLTRLGYRVIAAPSGQAALAAAAAAADAGEIVDLLLTDVVMPAMSGRELAERLLQRLPGLRVLYMSGYTADAVLRHGVSTATVDFMEKPVTPDDLARKVRDVLDRQPPAAQGSGPAPASTGPL